jgi:hypothetical protein
MALELVSVAVDGNFGSASRQLSSRTAARADEAGQVQSGRARRHRRLKARPDHPFAA